MTNKNWPATHRQKSYGRALEDQLDLDPSNWNEMSVDDASRRIQVLVDRKRFAQIVGSLQ
jgi:hypothetical protein